jgi:thioredoxin-related protein
MQSDENTTAKPAAKKPKINFAWILTIIFIALIARILLTKPAQHINWTEDYAAGFKQAQKQKKPVLLIFWKEGPAYCEDAMKDTYASDTVIKFVEENFVTIFIDTNKQPEIAKKHNVDYYPLQVVTLSPDDAPIREIRGYDPPVQFIGYLTEALEKIEANSK